MIKAEAHSDDYAVEAEFDATAWFEKATDNEIIELMNCGWGGDYPADDVAIDIAKTNEEVDAIFTHTANIANDPSKKDLSGFECHVEEEDALKWLKENRPHLLVESKE